MSEKYIKRTKKGKGKRKKEAIKYFKELSVGLKPIIDIALSSMIIRDSDVRKEKKEEQVKD